jgi:kynurenine formamidase
MIQNLGGDIDKVTGKKCIICAAPVKFVGGDAFPVRVLAREM